MKDLLDKLYLLAGKNARHVSNMLVFECLKGISDSWSLGAILFLLVKVCDHIFSGTAIVMGDIHIMTAIILLSVVGKIVFGYLADRHKNIAAYSLGAENRILIGDRLKNASMGYFSGNRLGEISGGMSTAVSDLETAGFSIIEALIVGMIQTAIMALFVLPYDVVTGLIIVVTLVCGLAVNGLAQKRADSLSSALLGLKMRLNANTLEYVKGISVLKAFGKNRQGASDLEDSISATRKGYLDVETKLVPVQFLYQVSFKIGSSVIVLVTLARFLGGDIDISKAMMLIIASFIVFSGFELAGSMQNIKGVAVQNLNTVLEMRSLPTIEQGERTDVDTARIEFRDVSFSYDGNNVFEGLSLSIPEGKTTAVVGPSGSGKTTLCNLAARFWDVQSGEVLVDGQNVKGYDYDALLANFSFVFQDVYLFDDTIRNNIKFGNPEASDEEMMAVSKRARCHDFIMGLPDGYDTVLQEGGSNLSGGERQRISIARAMLKPSKIVILDEATSSIDPENESQLLAALDNLLQGKTTIVIAHKLNTIRNADQIVVLGKDGVDSIGSHEELLRKSAIYRGFVLGKEEAANWLVTNRDV